jgi:sensor histidine kinase YesM
MIKRRTWLQHPVSRLLQHLTFWVLSYFVFLHLFKTSQSPEKVDYIYTALFHITLLPAVYLNLEWLLPRFANTRHWLIYAAAVIAIIALFTWINYAFFQDWSKYILPDYFFISYFTIWEAGAFFIIYLVISSLLKLSRSWFAVNELQRRLLQTEKEKVQIELQALKSQINPHFFFNTLNGIYAMTLEKDERLPHTVLQLSHLMRYLLYESKEDLVPLEKEWEVVQDYIALQKIRSNENLNVEKQVDGEITHQSIPPLLLITFLENAFKHGAKGNTGAASIRLFLQVQGNRFNFRVENTKGEINDIEQNDFKGVGLENVQRRLALLYPGRHRLTIEDTANHFIVNLQLQV